MREPSVRTSRIAIAAGLATALAIGSAGFLLGRASAPPSPPPQPPAVAAPAPPAPKEDATHILDRGDLASIVARATDALASGIAAPADLDDLPSRRFALALPFGCTGPAGADSPAALRWSYDDAAQALRVHVGLIAWQPDEWGVKADASPDAAPAPHGFWVPRPWSSAETCPTAAAAEGGSGTAPVTLPGQTLAIVSFAAGSAPEGGYDAVIRVPRDTLDMARGLRARLTGRIDRVPGNGPIRCVQPAGIDQQPVCAIAAVFDELVVDNPATGKTIATWSLGRVGQTAAAPAN